MWKTIIFHFQSFLSKGRSRCVILVWTKYLCLNTHALLLQFCMDHFSWFYHRILTHFVGGSIKEQPASCLTGLKLLLIQHKQSSLIQEVNHTEILPLIKKVNIISFKFCMLHLMKFYWHHTEALENNKAKVFDHDWIIKTIPYRPDRAS